MKITIFIGAVLILFSSYGQMVKKKQIELETLGSWPTVSSEKISPDGKYFAYLVAYPKSYESEIIIKSAKLRWKRSFKSKNAIHSTAFSNDSKQFVFISGDSLFHISLRDKNFYRTSIMSCKIPYNQASVAWIAYTLNNCEKTFVLRNLLTGSQLNFNNVIDYSFSKNANEIILQSSNIQDSKKVFSLSWINLEGKIKIHKIWQSEAGEKPVSLALSGDGKKLAFYTVSSGDRKIWLYTKGMKMAEMKVINNQSGIPANFFISSSDLTFSQNNQWLLFDLQKSDEQLTKQSTLVTDIPVDVWSYTDSRLQSRQLKENSINKTRYKTAISVGHNKEVRVLEKNTEKLQSIIDLNGAFGTGDYVIVAGCEYVPFWWQHSLERLYLDAISLVDGTRKRISRDFRDLAPLTYAFSPEGRYFMYWDNKRSGYFSFNCFTGEEFNTTSDIKASIVNEYPYGVDKLPATTPLGWYAGSRYFLFTDGYDIWKLDVTGKDHPINLTIDYGKRNSIRFRALDEEKSYIDKKKIYSEKDILLLTAFNMDTKYNGFFSCQLSSPSEPKLLTMGPYTYFKPTSIRPHFYTLGSGIAPQKAINSNCWIVQRSSAEEAPNYFFTRDFKSFKPVSDLHPEKEYNWLTTELIKWQLPDGKECHGVLYKPGNFDPKKKYPIIFNVYEKLSHRVYEFPYPHFAGANIDIAWFVSHDYLVCTPDIHYSIAGESGKVTGANALESLLSVAEYLAHRSYVDTNKMGIQGHSFGGGEASYILTHSNKFKAFAEFAGTTDYLSSYTTLTPSGGDGRDDLSKLELIEVGQGRMGKNVTPWSHPDLYDQASSIRAANHASAPLLITHNHNDNQIAFRHGTALYMALRRLSKPVWMLQYDGDGHGVSGKSAEDYTIRLTQFFDHYLKDKPAPRWMTQGVPAALKGIESRYELDPKGNCGKDCKVCKAWNAKGDGIDSSSLQSSWLTNQTKLK